jgi:acyl-CoA synthetase (AMP-forming)/AMP-acid ligase II
MLTPRDLHGIFEQHAPVRPGRILVSTAGDRAGLTAAQLRREIEHRVRVLRDSGAGPGAIVLLAGLQGAEFLCWLLATWASDAVALPADPQMTAAEVEIVRRGARAAVVITRAHAGGSARAAAQSG